MKPEVGYDYDDPGGKAAILPVIEQLRQDELVSVRHGADTNTQFVLLGTSIGDYEKNVVHWARLFNIPTLSVLDFWSNYSMRFVDIFGAACLPDKIAIMDEHARDEMIAEGFPPEKLVITGQPAFDCLADRRALFDSLDTGPYTRRYAIRRAHGVHPDTKLIVFASQPWSKMPDDLGYTEHTVIPLLIDALAEVAPDSHVIIRPHPRETEADLLQYERAANPTVWVKRKGNVHDLLMAADLVVGMNTELLVEACYLGCITLSLQPGLKGADRLPTNRLGVSAWNDNDICFHNEYMIYELLFNGITRQIYRDRLNNFTIKEKAAPKVAKLIYEMIGVNHV